MGILEIRKHIRMDVIRWCLRYMARESEEFLRAYVEKETDKQVRARIKLIKGGKYGT